MTKVEEKYKAMKETELERKELWCAHKDATKRAFFAEADFFSAILEAVPMWEEHAKKAGAIIPGHPGYLAGLGFHFCSWAKNGNRVEKLTFKNYIVYRRWIPAKDCEAKTYYADDGSFRIFKDSPHYVYWKEVR